MSDDLVRFLRDDVRFYIAAWEGEFACDDDDHKQADEDKAKVKQAAARIEALEAALAKADELAEDVLSEFQSIGCSAYLLNSATAYRQARDAAR